MPLTEAQERIINAVGTDDRLIVVNCPPGSGKCVGLKTHLSSPGGLIFAKDYQKTTPLETFRSWEQPSAIYEVLEAKTLRLETTDGYSLEATPEHPIYIWENEKIKDRKLENINPGDICVMKFPEEKMTEVLFSPPDMFFPQKLNAPFARLLGYWTGDGGLSIEGGMSFTNVDKKILKDYKECLNMFGLHSKRHGITEQTNSKPFWGFLRDIEGPVHLSKHKKVPSFMYQAPLCLVGEYIKAYFDCDGTVGSGNSHNLSVTMTSVSGNLIEGMQMLLLRMGIRSSIRKRKTAKSHGAWNLSIPATYVGKWIQRIGLPLSAEKRKRMLLAAEKAAFSHIDTLPFEETLRKKLKEFGNRRLRRMKKGRLRHYAEGSRRITRAGFEEAYALLKGDPEIESLKSLIDNGCFFAKVASVRHAGKQQVIDFTIPESHHFWSNGFISHNTFTASKIIEKVKGNRFLALTFNTRAAAELRTRCGFSDEQKVIYTKGGPRYCTTFHSYCYHYLMERSLISGVNTKLIDVVLNDILGKKNGGDDSDLSEMKEDFAEASAINSTKKEMLHAYNMATLFDEEPLTVFRNYLNGGLLPLCYLLPEPVKSFSRFLIEKRRNNLVVFSDLLAMTRNQIRGGDEDSFDYIVIDEAQDLDVMQINILRLLMSRVGKQVFLIGDEDQKIYSWRGATKNLLARRMGKRMPLDKSFRVKKNIADYAKRLIRWNKNRIDDDWEARKSDHKVKFFGGTKDQSLYPSEMIKDRLRDVPSLSILCRTNYPLNKLGESLLETGTTASIGQDYAYGFNKREAKNSMIWLEYVSDPEKTQSLSRHEKYEYFKKLALGIKSVGKKKWGKAYETAKGAGSFVPAHTAMRILASEKNIDADRLSMKPVDAQIEIITKLVTGEEDNWVKNSINWVRKHNHDYIKAIKSPKVTLSTIHRFKGKEDREILIVGLNDKLLPHKKSYNMIEEERRLAYVAITRSEGSVNVFFNQAKPSRFLYEMQTGCSGKNI